MADDLKNIKALLTKYDELQLAQRKVVDEVTKEAYLVGYKQGRADLIKILEEVKAEKEASALPAISVKSKLEN